MALRSSSKEWRRSRSQSFLDQLSTPPASPARRPAVVSITKRARRLPWRHRLAAAFIVLLGSFLTLLYLLSHSKGRATTLTNSTFLEHLVHPNFDFDHPSTGDLAQEEAGGLGGEDEARKGHDGNDHEEEEEEGEEEEEEEEVRPEPEWKQVHPEHSQNRSPPSPPRTALPFLPYSCDSCSATSPLDSSFSPVCSKYRPTSRKPPPSLGTTKINSRPLLNPDVLDRSIMFQGTGADVRRVLKRAMKSSLYGTKREREGKREDFNKFQDEEPFRILVLGGSVSNCRGVDQKTTCWHAGLLRWFQRTFPMEGDRDLVPDTPRLLVSDEVNGPVRLDGKRAKRSLDPPPRELVKRAAPRAAAKGSRKKGDKNTKKKEKKKKPTNRQRPSTRLINGSKSATGSSFFAYCFEEEMNLRGKNLELGKGPDLVILEYGVNDVYPHDEVATRDFEKHLRALRSLPSNPAVIVLEAASLLLASTTSFTQNAEYLHLPAAQFYDVPVLSAKQALFGSQSPFPSPSPEAGRQGGGGGSSTLEMRDLFLPDQHHPNDKGHEFLSDVLTFYLERQACIAQSEILEIATSRTYDDSRLGSNFDDVVVEPELDIVKRSQELPSRLPSRSLFTPFSTSSKPGGGGGGGGDQDEWIMPEPRCIQVGNSKTTIEPIQNSGWEKFGWARDKQYLVADKPGSTVSYEIQVGKGGTVLADWLRSRFYDLGDVSVFLDDDRSKAVTLAGYWDLGWSIGVPTEIFTTVAAGLHKVTFELLGPSQSSHPGKKTSFRLIGIITT